MDKEKHCCWDILRWLKEHNDWKYPFSFIKGQSIENNDSRHWTTERDHEQFTNTEALSLFFKVGNRTVKGSCVFSLHSIVNTQSCTHMLLKIWLVSLSDRWTSVVRYLTTTLGWAQLKNVSRLGWWWQDNSCLIQGNELNETLALCFSALIINWLGIYLPWQVGKLNSFTIGDLVIFYFRYRSDGEPASYHLHFREFALGIIPRSQGRKKEKSKISTVSNTILLSVEKTDQSFWVEGKTAKRLCMQIRQYKKIYLEIEMWFVRNKLSLAGWENITILEMLPSGKGNNILVLTCS